jgi:hypothetical protein
LVLELQHRWMRYLPALLLVIAALTIPALANLSLAAGWLCIFIGLSVAATSLWQTGLGRSARQLFRMSWDQEQRWQLQFGTDKPVSAILLGRSWCSPWVFCLKFKTDAGNRYQLLLWRNELSSDAWHQWLLRLRQEGGRHSGDGSVGITP